MRVAGIAGDAALYPCIASYDLCPGQGKVLHHSSGFGVFAKAGVKEAVGSCVLVGIAEGELVADRVFFEEAEGVADSDVVVCARKKARTIEVGPNHDEEVSACTGGIGLGVRRGRL